MTVFGGPACVEYGHLLLAMILKDESTREQYDYAIAHPEEVLYNTAQYYRAYYGHKTDPRAVLIGLLLIVSAFQYINQLTRYNQVWAWNENANIRLSMF